MSKEVFDTNLSVNELLANAVVSRAAVHLTQLLTTHSLRLATSTPMDHARERFSSWVKHSKRSKAFLILEKNPTVFISSPELAKAVGYNGRAWICEMTGSLRRWRVPVYDASGEHQQFAPFKRGRELWSCRRGSREDGTLIPGGVRMTLLTQGKTVTHRDACDIQTTYLPDVFSDLELLEGARTVVGADSSITDAQREEYASAVKQVAERLTGKVAGPQLALFAAGGKKSA